MCLDNVFFRYFFETVAERRGTGAASATSLLSQIYTTPDKTLSAYASEKINEAIPSSLNSVPHWKDLKSANIIRPII